MGLNVMEYCSFKQPSCYDFTREVCEISLYNFCWKVKMN